MKKINLSVIFALIMFSTLAITVISCVKEVDEPSSASDELTSISEERNLSITDLAFGPMEEEDASLSISFVEFIDQNKSGRYNFGCGALFTHEKENINIGDIALNNQPISYFSSENRYMESFIDAEVDRVFVPGDVLDFNLKAKSTQQFYKSLDTTFLAPASLNARVLLNGTGRSFDKNIGFEIEWDDDPNYPETYFILCQIGNKCLVKKVESGTVLSLEKEEYSYLDTGKLMTYYLIRGAQDCFRNNEKNVCYNLAVISKRSALKVIDSGLN